MPAVVHRKVNLECYGGLWVTWLNEVREGEGNIMHVEEHALWCTVAQTMLHVTD